MTSRQLGVDVSKAKLDVALLQVNGKFKSKVFENTVQGIGGADALAQRALGGPAPGRACVHGIHGQFSTRSWLAG